MNTKKIKKFIVYPNQTIKQVLHRFDELNIKNLIVSNKANDLLGSISDGDIRRALLNTNNLNSKINRFYNKKPKYFSVDKYTKSDLKNLFLKEKFDLIPIKKNNKIIDIVSWYEFFQNKNPQIKNTVFLLAGGKGSRLLPMTKILPKPLIPIKGKSIIQHIIDSFVDQNFLNFNVSINFKSNLMRAFFKEIKYKKKIKIIEEKKDLGTAGSLSLLVQKNELPIVVCNADSIVKINYAELIKFHENKRNFLTIVSALKNYQIPYGTCQIDKRGLLKKFIEKPNINFFTNIGMYIADSKIKKLIPKNQYFDFDQLINLCLKKKKKIGIYPIEDSNWSDYGKIEDF